MTGDDGPWWHRHRQTRHAGVELVVTVVNVLVKRTSTSSFENGLHMLVAVLVRGLQIMQLLIQIGELLLAVLALFRVLDLDIWDCRPDEPAACQPVPVSRHHGHHGTPCSHLPHTTIHRRLLRQRIHLRVRQLQHAALAVLRRDLGAHDAQLLLGEGGFGGDFLQQLRRGQSLLSLFVYDEQAPYLLQLLVRYRHVAR